MTTLRTAGGEPWVLHRHAGLDFPNEPDAGRVPFSDTAEAPVPRMQEPGFSSNARVVVDGKFFRVDGLKFHPKGVCYGPFGGLDAGLSGGCGTPATVSRDFQRIRQMGCNVVRMYQCPPHWVLDLAQEAGLRLMVDVAWNKHLCFLEDAESRKAALQAVREAAVELKGHPAVFALSVANEIPADIVRWSGASRVEEFIDALVMEARSVEPQLLCTFGNFPPTEFLRPKRIDFVCFNVYLHQPRSFENYLIRLQHLAGERPLVLGETGIDSIREGEDRQAEMLSWQIELAFRRGVAGLVVYSFTDEWWKDGRRVEDWAFGLTRCDRSPKPAFDAVRESFAIAPYFPLSAAPMVSVVVASYNGAATLRTCLESLGKLRYPKYEVLLVDDGSVDETQSVAGAFPGVRILTHPRNEGLSVARNTGIADACGEIIAFTDSDCRADEDWLYYLIGDLLQSPNAGIGGHNFLPPDDSCVAAAVMVSPGGPAHVMLDDRRAEHIPGCNMAFYKWALEEIGRFDPLFRAAGDDVDVCWRLQQRGYRIGFSPGGFVWHYRRNTVRAYLKQQAGYGDAEATLERRHPENFNQFGGSIWRGRIYSPAKMTIEPRRPVIYHGVFGAAFFQSIYTPPPNLALVTLTSIEYHALVTLPLLVLGVAFPVLISVGLASFFVSCTVCGIAAAQAEIAGNRKRWWSRILVGVLFFLQPIIRGGARHRRHWQARETPLGAKASLAVLSERPGQLAQRAYWCELALDRTRFLQRLLQELDRTGWPNRPDTGWNTFDVEIQGSRWARLLLVSAIEYHPGNKTLIRCRLAPRWSPWGVVLFWAVAAAGTLVAGAVNWILFLPIIVGLAGIIWAMEMAKENLNRLIATFLDEHAGREGLIKVEIAARP